MNTKIREKSRKLTRVLVKAVLANAALDAAMDEELDDETVGPGWSNTIKDMESLQSELDALQLRYNELVCSSFPGAAELFIKTHDGERQPTRSDLRDLCRANGIVLLDEGQFICGSCKGVRTNKDCEWCKLKEPSDDVGEPAPGDS